MGTWTFAYDHLNRLLSGKPSTGAYSGQNLCLAYDSFGNRTQSDLQTTACKPNPTPSVANSAYDPNTANYSAANQVGFTTVNAASNGFAYDAAGDVTFDGANYYSYDAEGRVCATQTAPYSGGVVAYGYVYDAEGRRVAKGSITPAPLGQFPSCNPATNGFTLTESYVLGQGGERLTTTAWFPAPGIALVAKAANAVPVPIVTLTGAWQNTNVYAGAKLIATYDAPTAGVLYDAGSAGGLHFQLTDPLGTRRVQTNSAGEAELDCQSLPFGDQLSCFPDPNAPGDDQDEDATGSLTGTHFTGKERDAESGLDYFGARYYASNIGRWMSPDLVNVTEERMMNPSSTLNKYAYAANNPLKYVDPDGQDITYFYDPGGVAGHAVLFAYNQANGDSAIESFGPAVHSPIWSGKSQFDMDEFKSAQGLRDNYASVTIQTTPELTQQVIDFIRQNPDPAIWTMLGPNCSSEVQKILKQFKLNNPKSFWPGMTPKNLWYSLMGRYNPSQAAWGHMTKPVQGRDYGNPRFDMFDLMWQSLPQSHEKVTSKILDWKPLPDKQQ